MKENASGVQQHVEKTLKKMKKVLDKAASA